MKNLDVKRDELAEKYRRGHVTRDVWKEDKCFRDGWNAACKELVDEANKLSEIVELIIVEWSKPTDGVQRGELVARLSQYSSDARDALAEWRKFIGTPDREGANHER